MPAMRAAGWVLRSALRAASSTPAGPGRQAALQCGTQDAARLTTGQAWSSALLQQQRAWFGAGRVGDEELEEGLVVPKVPRKPGTKTKPKNQDEELPPKPEHEAHAQRLAAQERIRLLLQAEGAEADRGNEAAEQFVQRCVCFEGGPWLLGHVLAPGLVLRVPAGPVAGWSKPACQVREGGRGGVARHSAAAASLV